MPWLLVLIFVAHASSEAFREEEEKREKENKV